MTRGHELTNPKETQNCTQAFAPSGIEPTQGVQPGGTSCNPHLGTYYVMTPSSYNDIVTSDMWYSIENTSGMIYIVCRTVTDQKKT